ncbi:unnamed protein product [Mytilus coruscus]|uniref:Uncharacterized protein n=1 Tax=Mytilus coruscus TaxID=42192 RepID=A0A6J8DLJ9_MYTCO|nr:unnamed protein product [Mytilus coruscus]
MHCEVQVINTDAPKLKLNPGKYYRKECTARYKMSPIAIVLIVVVCVVIAILFCALFCKKHNESDFRHWTEWYCCNCFAKCYDKEDYCCDRLFAKRKGISSASSVTDGIMDESIFTEMGGETEIRALTNNESSAALHTVHFEIPESDSQFSFEDGSAPEVNLTSNTYTSSSSEIEALNREDSGLEIAIENMNQETESLNEVESESSVLKIEPPALNSESQTCDHNDTIPVADIASIIRKQNFVNKGEDIISDSDAVLPPSYAEVTFATLDFSVQIPPSAPPLEEIKL